MSFKIERYFKKIMEAKGDETIDTSSTDDLNISQTVDGEPNPLKQDLETSDQNADQLYQQQDDQNRQLEVLSKKLEIAKTGLINVLKDITKLNLGKNAGKINVVDITSRIGELEGILLGLIPQQRLDNNREQNKTQTTQI